MEFDSSDAVIFDRVDACLRVFSNGDDRQYNEWRLLFKELISMPKPNKMIGEIPFDRPGVLTQPKMGFSNKKTQIIVSIVGGLGDQFFRYATARLLAISSDAEIKYDDTNMQIHPFTGRACVLQYFNTIGEHASNVDFANLVAEQFTGTSLQNQSTSEDICPYVVDFSEDSHCCNLHNNRILYLVNGAEWPCFEAILPRLKKELTLKDSPRGENAKTAELILTSPMAVSVHVRLTDFVPLGRVTPMDYYQKAMAIMADKVINPHFFIFSDDIKKIKHRFNSRYPITFVDHNNIENGYEDFRLMTLCRHHIICNSSFSWWAALLSEYDDKFVLQPRGGFKSPQEWIVVSNYSDAINDEYF